VSERRFLRRLSLLVLMQPKARLPRPSTRTATTPIPPPSWGTSTRTQWTWRVLRIQLAMTALNVAPARQN